MVVHRELTLHTTAYQQILTITRQVEEAVRDSGVRSGVAYIITAHTTTGIMVNEDLECLLGDMQDFLGELVPENRPYAHARMLHSYGTTAGNPTGHIRSMLSGNHCVFPVVDGALRRGGAQDIFFCEFDGAQSRTVYVTVMGEE